MVLSFRTFKFAIKISMKKVINNIVSLAKNLLLFPNLDIRIDDYTYFLIWTLEFPILSLLVIVLLSILR